MQSKPRLEFQHKFIPAKRCHRFLLCYLLQTGISIGMHTGFGYFLQYCSIPKHKYCLDAGPAVLLDEATVKLSVSSAEAAQNLQFPSVLIILVVFLLQVCHSITFPRKYHFGLRKHIELMLKRSLLHVSTAFNIL